MFVRLLYYTWVSPKPVSPQRNSAAVTAAPQSDDPRSTSQGTTASLKGTFWSEDVSSISP